MFDDRFHPMVARGRALGPHPDLPRFQVRVIIDQDHLFDGDLIPVQDQRGRDPGIVHKSIGLGQYELMFFKAGFGQEGFDLVLFLEVHDAQLRSNFLDHPEP